MISGIVHVLKAGCRWKDCPAVYGPPTTIQPIQPLELARAVGPHLRRAGGAGRRPRRTQHRLHRRARAPLGARRKRGAVQASGHSRGGPTTKFHALTDACGRAVALLLTPGNIAEISAAPGLLAAIPPARRQIADKGYDANSLRQALGTQGTKAVIPSTASRKRALPHDAVAYRARNMIERALCSIKDYRRIATRYDKLARNFLSAIAIAAIILWWT